MAKQTTQRKSIIGAVGGVLIGAAILLFVSVMVLQSLKSVNTFGEIGAKDPSYSSARNDTLMANWAAWNASNATIEQIKTFLTVCVILLGVLGIIIIGSSIISSIGGGFGG